MRRTRKIHRCLKRRQKGGAAQSLEDRFNNSINRKRNKILNYWNKNATQKDREWIHNIWKKKKY